MHVCASSVNAYHKKQQPNCFTSMVFLYCKFLFLWIASIITSICEDNRGGVSTLLTTEAPGWTMRLKKGRGTDQTEIGLGTFIHQKHLHQIHLLCFFLSLYYICK